MMWTTVRILIITKLTLALLSLQLDLGKPRFVLGCTFTTEIINSLRNDRNADGRSCSTYRGRPVKSTSRVNDCFASFTRRIRHSNGETLDDPVKDLLERLSPLYMISNRHTHKHTHTHTQPINKMIVSGTNRKPLQCLFWSRNHAWRHCDMYSPLNRHQEAQAASLSDQVCVANNISRRLAGRRCPSSTSAA